jgi:glycosyltransferase involved in cell wall biosynthesis
LDAVRIALEVACDPSSFLYALGPNPALILRLLEWLTSGSIQDEDLQKALHREVSHRLARMAFAEGEGDWEWMWRTLAAAWGNHGSKFIYSAIDPAMLGRLELASRRNGRIRKPILPLKEYLIQFLGHSDLEPVESSFSRIVILCRDSLHRLNALKKDSLRLVFRGLQIVVFGMSSTPYDWNQGAPILALNSPGRDKLPWMGRIDICFVCDSQGESVWLEADHWLTIHNLEAECSYKEIDRAIQDLNKPSNFPVIEVIFLERVLSGGGAEKVVMDTVKNLDRKKFKVSVLTLFDGLPCNELPPDVDVHCLRPITGAIVQNEEVAGTTVRTVWFYRFFKRAYYAVTSEQIRKQLKIANRLRRTYSMLKSVKCFARGYWHSSPAMIVGKARSFLRNYCQIFRKLHVKPVNLRGNSNKSSTSPPATSKSTLLTCHNGFLNALAEHWPASYALSEYLSSFDKDVILVTVMEEAAAAAWLSHIYRKNFRHIAWFHTLESAYLPEMYSEAERCEIERWVLGNAARNAAHVVLPSQGCRTDLIESFRVDGGKVGVISNSINVARIRRLGRFPFPASDTFLEAKYFRFVCVARLSPEKNHALLIRACTLLKDQSAKFEVVLIGGGPLESEIREMINDYHLSEQFQLLGFLSNPYPIVASSDALILTSNYESFGVVLLESMACGIPIIATDCPFGPREVCDDKRCGVLVPPGDPEQFALAMQKVMEDADLRMNMIEAGYKHVEMFDVRNITRQWEDLIEKVHGGRLPVTIKAEA